MSFGMCAYSLHFYYWIDQCHIDLKCLTLSTGLVFWGHSYSYFVSIGVLLHLCFPRGILMFSHFRTFFFSLCTDWWEWLWGRQGRILLCSFGWPGTHSIDQAILKLRDPPASAPWVLGLKVWATTAQFVYRFFRLIISCLEHKSI